MAAGSRSMPITSPSRPTPAARARACPPPPSVPSTSTAPGRGCSQWTTWSNSTGTCTDDGSGMFSWGQVVWPAQDETKHPASGASMRLCEVECLRSTRRHRGEVSRFSQRGDLLGSPSVRTIFTLAPVKAQRRSGGRRSAPRFSRVANKRYRLAEAGTRRLFRVAHVAVA